MNIQIEESWKRHLQGEFEKPYFVGLTDKVQTRCDRSMWQVRVIRQVN